MIICGTGHRPSKLGGWNLPNPTYNSICKQIENILVNKKPNKIISGMSLGFDQWLANIAIKLNIPYIAAIPFVGQESVWNKDQKNIYNLLLKKADSIKIISDGEYSASKMQIRNQWMVDNSDIVIAAWDGSPSGTGNCVNYAKFKNKEIIVLDIKNQ